MSSNGSVLVAWVDVSPGITYNITVGTAGTGQLAYFPATTVSPASPGSPSSFTGPNGISYVANGGVPIGTPVPLPVTTPPSSWNESPVYRLYGVGGNLGSQLYGSNGSPGLNGAVIIEWVD